MNSNVLVNAGSNLTTAAIRMRLPLIPLIKRTVFSQFCGGETLHKTMPLIDELAEKNVLSVLDYGVEAKKREGDFDTTALELINAIEFAGTRQNVPIVSCKITGLARFALLEKLHNGEELSGSELSEWARVKYRINKLCSHAHAREVGLFIDAEETWIQNPVDELANEMMEKYNREQIIVYNTFQLYLKDKLNYLISSYERAAKRGYILGAKLVRGAYMEKERLRAKKKNYPSPVHENKEAVDRDYDAAMKFCLDHHGQIALCSATHNEKSNLKLAEWIEERQLDKNHPHLFFCQLFGMSDHITFNLADAGFRVGKFIPYGPVKDVIPYLIRRAQENTSVGGQMGKELSLYSREIKRRRLLREVSSK